MSSSIGWVVVVVVVGWGKAGWGSLFHVAVTLLVREGGGDVHVGVEVGGGGGPEDPGQVRLGDLGAADLDGVAGVLHLPEALLQDLRLHPELLVRVGADHPDQVESLADLVEEAEQLEADVRLSGADHVDGLTHHLAWWKGGKITF